LEQFYYNEDLLQGYVTEFATNRVTDMSFETNQGALDMAIESMRQATAEAELDAELYKDAFDAYMLMTDLDENHSPEQKQALYEMAMPYMQSRVNPNTGVDLTLDATNYEEYSTASSVSKGVKTSGEIAIPENPLTTANTQINQYANMLSSAESEYMDILNEYIRNNPRQTRLARIGFNRSDVRRMKKGTVAEMVLAGNDPLRALGYPDEQQIIALGERMEEGLYNVNYFKNFKDEMASVGMGELDAFMGALVSTSTPGLRITYDQFDNVFKDSKISIGGQDYVWQEGTKRFRQTNEKPVERMATQILGGIINVPDPMTGEYRVQGGPFSDRLNLAPSYSMEEVRQMATAAVLEGDKEIFFQYKDRSGKTVKKTWDYEEQQKIMKNIIDANSEIFQTPEIAGNTVGARDAVTEMLRSAVQSAANTPGMSEALLADLQKGNLDQYTVGFNVMDPAEPEVFLRRGGRKIHSLSMNEVPTESTIQGLGQAMIQDISDRRRYNQMELTAASDPNWSKLVATPVADVSYLFRDGREYTQYGEIIVKRNQADQTFYLQEVIRVYDDQGNEVPGFTSIKKFPPTGSGFSSLYEAVKVASY
jgi:hypothetical protein